MERPSAKLRRKRESLLLLCPREKNKLPIFSTRICSATRTAHDNLRVKLSAAQSIDKLLQHMHQSLHSASLFLSYTCSSTSHELSLHLLFILVSTYFWFKALKHVHSTLDSSVLRKRRQTALAHRKKVCHHHTNQIPATCEQ